MMKILGLFKGPIFDVNSNLWTCSINSCSSVVTVAVTVFESNPFPLCLYDQPNLLWKLRLV